MRSATSLTMDSSAIAATIPSWRSAETRCRAPKTTLNFRSTLSKGDFSATAYVNNLTDNRTPSNAVASGDARIVASDFTLSGNAGQRYSASISAPRSYGVTLNYRF